MNNTVEDFRKWHDPRYEHQLTQNRYSGVPVPKGTVRFLITSAQNATPVDPKFWVSLLHCRNHYKAHLSVIPYRYKNPTSSWTGSRWNAEYWVEEVQDYLNDHCWQINKNLTVLGDTKIVPTAKDPLQGNEGKTGAESSIIGHPNLSFRSVPVPGHKMAKILTTTGSCTVLNYTDTRAGRDGEFQHVTGAVIVEVEGGFFWLRHLNANGKGEFIDKDLLFTPKGVEKAPVPEAVVTGDAHVRRMDPSVDKAVFGPKGIIHTLRPKKIVFHDIYDGFTSNPYDWKEPFNLLAKLKAGKDVVRDELNETVQFVVDRTPQFAESYIIDSNHDQFLKSWVEKNRWQDVGLNGDVWFELGKTMWEGSKLDKDLVADVPSPFQYWVSKFKHPRIHCLTEEDSLKVHNVELGMHGHRGLNGARGSLQGLVKTGVKFVIGHVHGPGIRFGGYAVGLMAKMRHGYNKGPSNWLHTMCVVHGSPCGGKRQLITIIDGRPWL